MKGPDCQPKFTEQTSKWSSVVIGLEKVMIVGTILPWGPLISLLWTRFSQTWADFYWSLLFHILYISLYLAFSPSNFLFVHMQWSHIQSCLQCPMLALFCLLKSYLLSATIISFIRDFLFHVSSTKPKLPVWYPHPLKTASHSIIKSLYLSLCKLNSKLDSPMMPIRLLQNYGHSPKDKFQIKLVENYNHSKKIRCDPPHSQMLFFP